MDPHLFTILAEKYVNRTATADERDVVEAYWAVLSERPIDELTPAAIARIGEEIREGVLAAIVPVRKIPFYKRVLVRYAAAVFLFAVATTYFLLNKQKDQTTAIAFKGDVPAPVINKATLTLANGKQIVFDSTKMGSLANAGAVNARKTGDGLTYTNQTTTIEYHTLTNPKGSKPVELTLADGTKAWLNAASSITFPTTFTGSTREVTMTGEAYFEVVHNEKQPFKVHAGSQTIEDIGTSFNVNAYTDESSVKTTLVEGVVKIDKAVLKPGQQYSNGNIETVNIERTIAWKNGFFGFDNADIQTVMRQLSRWYDVDVRYEGVPNNEPFQGKIGRELTLATVLKKLEQMHVHFRIEEDKRIVILP